MERTIELDNLFRLDGMVVVVTGASGLLGKKHVEAIAAFGGTPILLDLKKKIVDKLAADINKRFNVNAIGFELDITNESEVKKNTKSLIQRFGKIDALVNNAANNPKIEDNERKDFSRLENFQISSWDRDISVGLTGAYFCSKHYGMEISKNSHGGVIINISSDLGLIAPDQRLYTKDNIGDQQQPVKPVTYSVTKSGLIGLTRYLSTYWPQKVRSNAICPGGVYNNQDNSFVNKVKNKIPMGRMANVNEIQGTLVYLLSNASSYVNGAIISVDGGRTVW
jgi:NAD(P)-dependent dehydrogenase (short-subunit alcohol dehydrogenase family)